MKIAISQSNYLPWKGYFDLIQSVDEFVFFDEVQFTRRDWRNRNVIRNLNKKNWITVPVKNKGNYKEIISNIEVYNNNWKNSHLDLIKQCYSKSEHFEEIYHFFSGCYSNIDTDKLSEINKSIIIKICNFLNFNTPFVDSKNIDKTKNKISASERLLEICISRKANIYVSGSAAKNYLDEKLFNKNGGEVNWFDYGNSKVYKQPFKDFYENLSIVDCLMNCGKDKDKFLNF